MEIRNEMSLQALCEKEGTTKLEQFDFIGKDGKRKIYYSLGSHKVIWASDRAHKQIVEGNAALKEGSVEKARNCFKSIMYAEYKKNGAPDFDERGCSNWFPTLTIGSPQQRTSSYKKTLKRNEMSFSTFCEKEGTTELRSFDFIGKDGKKHIFYSLGNKKVIWASDGARLAIERGNFKNIQYAEFKLNDLPDFDDRGRSNWVPSLIINNHTTMSLLFGNINEYKSHNPVNKEDSETVHTQTIEKKGGNGFADIAGMTILKEQLQSDVIDIIHNPEQAKELGITLPNGLLFYGPPGCGKTFFAEKFAEETGFNYKYIKCSDIASPYIHGGQGKIAEIFDEARKNAPTILFFDEIDAMIKDRGKHNNVSESGEVNEFLTQLNNCGEDGVLVIGATNKPTEIDEAALRAGRLEFKYYIPHPDAQTRASIFEINLSKRKCDLDIDCKKLSDMTENYVSADIKMIVDNAARLAFRRKIGKITQHVLEEVIAKSKPSISIDVIKKHEAIRKEFMGEKETHPRARIGFN